MTTIRVTVHLDKDLLERAQRARPQLTKTAVIEAGLRELLARDAAEKLIALGGTARGARMPRRRRGRALR